MENKTYRKEWSGFHQQFIFLVECAPLVGILSAASLPRLQVQSRPDYIEQSKYNKYHILNVLQTQTYSGYDYCIGYQPAIKEWAESPFPRIIPPKGNTNVLFLSLLL